MFYTYLILALVTLLVAFVSGNNLSAAVGTLIGSKILSLYGSILIAVAGFVAGLVIQGGSLHSTAIFLIPDNLFIITISLAIALGIFVIAAIVRVPLSLVMALVGVSIGITLKFGITSNWPIIRDIVITWIIAPVGSVVVAFYLNRRFAKLQPKDVWNYAVFIKLMLIAVSFFTSFTLGANTLGFIDEIARVTGYDIIFPIIGIIVGSFFLSKGVSKRVGQDMYSMRYTSAFISLIVSSVLVEVATVFGYPLSNTQTLTSSVFGSGLSYRTKAMDALPYLFTVAMWVVSPGIGIILGYFIA